MEHHYFGQANLFALRSTRGCVTRQRTALAANEDRSISNVQCRSGAIILAPPVKSSGRTRDMNDRWTSTGRTLSEGRRYGIGMHSSIATMGCRLDTRAVRRDEAPGPVACLRLASGRCRSTCTITGRAREKPGKKEKRKGKKGRKSVPLCQWPLPISEYDNGGGPGRNQGKRKRKGTPSILGPAFETLGEVSVCM